MHGSPVVADGAMKDGRPALSVAVQQSFRYILAAYSLGKSWGCPIHEHLPVSISLGSITLEDPVILAPMSA